MIKKFSILITLFLVSCMPMELKIQQAIYQTQTAEITILLSSTPAPTITNTPFSTSTPKPAATPRLKYTLVIGFCPTPGVIVGDPKNMGCEAVDIKPIYPSQADYITLSTKDSLPFLFMYCAIYDEKHKLIDAQMEKKGSGTVRCSLK